VLRTRSRSRVGAGGVSRDALILILLGQSNNATRNTAVSTTVSSKAYMPAGGTALEWFQFFATNVEHSAVYSDVASAIAHTEGAKESPTAGVISTLASLTSYGRIYAHSVAIGSRTTRILGADGPRCNLYAVVHKLCDHARAAGYTPYVAFDSMHGEASMGAVWTETEYYDEGLRYYKLCQLVAAQAMGSPSYVAPVALHHPIQMATATVDADGAFARGIHRAIKRIAADLTNGVAAGPSYNFSSENDRIHNDAVGFRTRGELGGYALAQDLNGGAYTPLQISGTPVLSGSTVTVTFNAPITRDTGVDYGTSLDTSNALAGFQYFDNGSAIKINSMSIAGAVATLTLNSTPAGTIGQQQLRIGMQATPGTGTGSDLRAGSQIRATTSLFTSIYDAGFTHYRWATPEYVGLTT